MEVPELNLKECESVFVKDEFYENIQAPKFHDFCSDEDPVVDADAYFRRLGGRFPRPSTDPFIDQNAFKKTKESIVLKPPGLPKAPLSSRTLNMDATSPEPKARSPSVASLPSPLRSAAGIKKGKPALPLPATPPSKNQDKAPSKNRLYQRVSPVSNASLSSPRFDVKGNDSLQASSTVKSCHTSENTDPNRTSQARREVIDSGDSKSDALTVLTVTAGPCSLHGPDHREDDSKVAIESQFRVKSKTPIPKPSKEKTESMPRSVTDPTGVGLSSDVKDRKCKPTPCNVEARVEKVYETRSRVLKQQRKDFDCSSRIVTNLGPSSSQSARTSCSEPVRAPAGGRPTPRGSCDNNCHKRASDTLISRQGRTALMTSPKSIAKAAREITGNAANQVSLNSPMKFGLSPRKK